MDIAKGTLDDFGGRIDAISKTSGRSGILSIVHCLVEADLGADGVSLNSTPLLTYSPSTKSWSKRIPLPLSDAARNASFDVASCQFAMHYMFETRTKASRFFAEISRNLRPGGYFIATTMDSRVVADWALQEMTRNGVAINIDNGEDRNGTKHDLCIYADDLEDSLPGESGSGGKNDGTEEAKHCNDLMLRMEFEDTQWKRLVEQHTAEAKQHEAHDDSFGVRYRFTLYDTPPTNTGASAVNAPEWLVPLGRPLQELAEEHGLRLVLCKNFHSFIVDNMKNPDMM